LLKARRFASLGGRSCVGIQPKRGSDGGEIGEVEGESRQSPEGFRVTVRAARRLGLLVALVLGLAGAALAQDVPALQSPDVTNLMAPASGAAGDDQGIDDADNGPPPPCGSQPISIASLRWPSAELLAAIHARILKSAFGCTVQVLPADMGSALAGMASTGQPAVAPEMWIDRVADAWNSATKDLKLRQVGLTYGDTRFEGWYVPDYVMSAHPELKAASALKADAAVFATNGGKPQFISCPADWACSVINRNLLNAEGLDGVFDVIEPKNRYDLDQAIAAAINRKAPILFYYWQPNAALAQFSFRPVDLGAYNKDAFACLGKRACANPRPTSFAPEPVVVALAEWVFTGAPEIAAYFQRAEMPIEVMNGLLAQLNASGATVDGVAAKFVADHPEIWRKWTDLPAAAPAGAPANDDGADSSSGYDNSAGPPPATSREAPAQPMEQPGESPPNRRIALPPPSLVP
jgi:glycine betaine/proline transport system substrate-binding protein